jgi:molecular chaperone DnaJ
LPTYFVLDLVEFTNLHFNSWPKNITPIPTKIREPRKNFMRFKKPMMSVSQCQCD